MWLLASCVVAGWQNTTAVQFHGTLLEKWISLPAAPTQEPTQHNSCPCPASITYSINNKHKFITNFNKFWKILVFDNKLEKWFILPTPPPLLLSQQYHTTCYYPFAHVWPIEYMTNTNLYKIFNNFCKFLCSWNYISSLSLFYPLWI